jgi:hypothetical protein
MITDGVQRRVNRWRQLRAAARVLDTPPIRPTSDRVVIFSMAGTKVLLPYLVAVKSLYRQLGVGRVVILDDGTFTAADRRVLDRHLGQPQVLSLSDCDTGRCPRGGTWERLLTLLDLRSDDYVIQLDSDTVTIGAIPEVVDAVAANQGFILPGGPESEGVGILPLHEFVAWRYPQGAPPGRPHIQHALEARLADYPEAARNRYVRGCSGFAGFSRGGPSDRAAAEAFSVAGEGLTGAERWREWGTEQITSSFLLANEAGTRLLPYDRYRNYWLDEPGGDARFVHFLGTHRYATDTYRRLTARALQAL